MDVEEAAKEIVRFLREGAELRMKVAQDCAREIAEAASWISECLRRGGKLLLFGNGGSAANAQHLAAEFVGRFMKERRALSAMALTTDTSILTAVGNDYGFDQIFSRQIAALGRAHDVAIGISTSGKSPNVIEGMKEARKRDLKTIGLVGNHRGGLADCVEIAIKVGSANTAQIQECQIAIGHLLCDLVEKELFPGSAR